MGAEQHNVVGYNFINNNCGQCARDRAAREGMDLDECDDDELCEILNASFRGEAVEWRHLPTGEVKCLAFIPADEPIPAPRCNKTIDMFEN
ncbi:hypothetical protein ACMYR3_06010 [Ampullimonas aquatilis]|uniref:hypothetical protein n=1 Tax=Ampullimonas aquatilis TaxID=1341549 RepID=UPI003C70DC92